MNKVILGLILAVCVLGLALVLLNERLGRKNEPASSQPAIAEHRMPATPTLADVAMPPANDEAQAQNPMTAPGIAGEAMEYEQKEAEEALAPPPPATARPAPDRREPRQEEAAQTPPPREAKPAPARTETQKPAPARTETQKPARAETQKPEPKAEAKAPEPAKPQAADKNRSITRFVIFSRENGATVRIGGNGPISYKQMLLENPNRFVLDLDGDWHFPANPGIPKNDLVSSVRVGKIGDKTRVVIDLKEKPRRSRVIETKNRDSVDVRVDK